ncbi:MAG: hypothetical protein JWP63_6944, partial [Candidatus Solibacter sp.]|nr:hypothetical protein [Candidatus Solibacter sp.]
RRPMAAGSGSFSPARDSRSNVPAYAVLLGAVLTALTCVSLGSLLLRDACRVWGVRFV